MTDCKNARSGKLRKIRIYIVVQYNLLQPECGRNMQLYPTCSTSVQSDDKFIGLNVHA